MPSAPMSPRLVSRIPPPPRADDAPGDDGDGLSPGHILEGRYEIEEQIGEGGIGVVYRARQLKLHRSVAVKLLLRDQIGDHLLRPRFEREAVTLAALSHPNIVGLTDYGMIRGRPFIVMELLEGRTLRAVIDEEGALEPARALLLCRQILYALAYAHPLGVVHRDLKPANIVVQTAPDQPEHVKLLDFGLVKLLPGSQLDAGVKLSRAGFAIGTPAYMSPEHATGGDVDERSDIYAVGILLFEMLTGQKPFDGELDSVLRSHLGAPVPKLGERKAELASRADLQAIVDKAMAKVRSDRFRTASEMLAAIDALGEASKAKRTSARVPGQDPFEDLWGRLEDTIAPSVERARAFYGERAQPSVEHAYAITKVHAHSTYVSLRTRLHTFWIEAKPKLAEFSDRAKSLQERMVVRVKELRSRPSLPAPRTLFLTSSGQANTQPPIDAEIVEPTGPTPAPKATHARTMQLSDASLEMLQVPGFDTVVDGKPAGARKPSDP